MDPDFQAELSWLSRALRAHLEWNDECGTHAVPHADAAWIERRREEYRRYELEPEAPPTSREHEAGAAAAPNHAATLEPHVPSRQQPAGRHASGESGHDKAAPAPPDGAPARPDDSPPAPHDSPPARPNNPPAPHDGAAARPEGGSPARSASLPAQLDPSTPLGHVTPSSAAARSLSERHQRLSVLADEVRQCTRCALHRERTQTVFARGTGSSGLVFVGEGPGADEDAQGYPFVGKAGQLLDRMIAAMGLTRDDVYVCNIVKCRPPNNRKPDADEMAACRPFVVEQLELIQPQVIVALGATAVQGLLGVTLGITRLRGQWRLYQGQIPVMPTFHPAYLLRQPSAKRLVWEDLQQVLKQMQLPLPERR